MQKGNWQHSPMGQHFVRQCQTGRTDCARDQQVDGIAIFIESTDGDLGLKRYETPPWSIAVWNIICWSRPWRAPRLEPTHLLFPLLHCRSNSTVFSHADHAAARLILLTLISLQASGAHGISHEGSVTNAPALFGRDDTANYVVYPNDTQNGDQATKIYNLLKGVVSDPTEIFNSTTDNGSQHWFWAAPLTSANAEKVKGDSNVRMDDEFLFDQCSDWWIQIAAVVQQCTSNCSDPTGSDDTSSSISRRSSDSIDDTEAPRLLKRDGQLVNAHNVDDEVAFISLAQNQQLGDDFVYDNTAGTDQTVYIVDTGAGLGNADVDFFTPKAKLTWLKHPRRSSPDMSLRIQDTSKPEVQLRTMASKTTYLERVTAQAYLQKPSAGNTALLKEESPSSCGFPMLVTLEHGWTVYKYVFWGSTFILLLIWKSPWLASHVLGAVAMQRHLLHRHVWNLRYMSTYHYWLRNGKQQAYDDWLPTYDANVREIPAAYRPENKLIFCGSSQKLRLQL